MRYLQSMRMGWRVLAVVLAIPLFSFSVLVFRRPANPLFEGRYASEWVNDLLSSDYKTRTDAQAALRTLGEPAVPQIRLLLQKRNAPWQKYLVRLNRWLPFLDYEIADSVLCRQRGAEMIGMLGAAGRAAIPSLISSLSIEPCAAEAERALLRCGPASLPHLTQALRHGSPEVRTRAARLIGEFENVPPETIGAIIRLFSDREIRVRRQAALTLGELAPRETGAILRFASDPAPDVRAAAMEALAKGAGEASVVFHLSRALSDPAVQVRLQAAKALWQLKRETDSTVPVLTEILPTREGWQAAYALAQMGEAAAPAVPSLVEALRRERVPRPCRTPPSSAFALGQIAGPAIRALRPLLGSPDSRTRLNALMAVSFMGRRGRDAVPELLPLLEDKEPEVRHAAALTLASIGADKSQILDGLSACLHAEDIYMRSTAAHFLREIAPEQNWVVSPE